MKTNDSVKNIIIVFIFIWFMILSSGILNNARNELANNPNANTEKSVYDGILDNEKETNVDKNLSEEKTGLLNINLATKEDFMKLDGIDESLADEIVSYRQSQGGGFLTRDELKKVPGMTEEIYQSIYDKITINI